eukprot:TRINITY_DN827_c0_g2_i3.p1 TRINITY_DN827_c0_g2~~TRINITY_DN827_c0_g2_i3.p1  ORF type:complete len:315 (-),score=55.78 TRINITY_DN827_c0_g2_i3:777-1721(-)
MSLSDYKKMTNGTTPVNAVLFAPESPVLDPNAIVMAILAVTLIVVGACWTNLTCTLCIPRQTPNDYLHVTHGNSQQYEKIDELVDTNDFGRNSRTDEGEEHSKRHTETSREHSEEDSQEHFKEHSEEMSSEHSLDDYSNENHAYVSITWKWAVFYTIMACVTIVSLYFLYSYLVYVFYALFLFASSTGIQACLRPLVICAENIIGKSIPNSPSVFVHRYIGRVSVTDVFWILFSTSFPVIWIIYRHSEWAWLLQDLLGICIVLSVFKTLRLPSLKISVILLGLFFCYDIFFVFITPLFTNGKSIMEAIATALLV